ncbi:MAG: aminopeptidase N [Nocardioidaceae bacterium]
MANLTVGDAQRRAAAIAVNSYEIELDLDRGESEFESSTVITFTSVDGSPTFVDIAADALHAVELNGQPLDPASLSGERISLQPAPGVNVLTVNATMTYSHDGEGLHRSVDPEDGRAYVYAMTFLDAAPRVFACFDQPDLKAELTLRVKVPYDWTVVGNGPATARQTVGGEPPDGWWELATTKPLSTYFMTLVAGPYHSILREHDGITLGLHCRRSLAPHLDKDADELFKLTGECFDEYHRLFGIRYPFGEYHQAFVPEFNAGAMENPGCVTFADDMVFKAQATDAQRSDRANVVAHEMAHQWFGDLVTMRWWDDLWLNESFADYMGHRVCVDATDFTDNWLLFALTNKGWGLAADQRSSTHPVAGNGSPDARSALTNFDGISYAKGAVVLRQLNNYVGEEAFIAGIVDHLTRHSYGNATLADLVASWELSSGKDLSEWTRSWLTTSGVDTLSVRHGSTTTVGRRNGSPEDVSRTHAIHVTSYDEQGAATTLPVVLSSGTTDIALDSTSPTALVLPDSFDESWAKIELDPAATAKLPALLPRIQSSVSRAVVWGALRDALLDARMSPDEYLDVVCAALPEEPDDQIVDRVLTEASSRAGTYLHTDAQLERLELLVADMLKASEGGSNRQLLVSRQLLKASTDVAMLWSWLDGHGPDGLLVDADMRWRVLTQLCALGVAGRDEIRAEREADPSSQGAVAALRCRAAVPTIEGKADTWATIASDTKINNYDLYALCGSFFRASQQEVTRPYVARYFTDLPATARFRSGWVVELSCRASFPRFAVTEETVHLAEATLANDDGEPFARRAISDGTDDLRRVLASRAAFAAR